MNFKKIRLFNIEPFIDVDLNMLFRLEVRTRDMPAYGSYYHSNTLTWTAHNPAADKPAWIRLIDVYDVFTPSLLENANFKIELAKWFNGVVDDILDSEGAWDTGAVIAYFKQAGHPPPYVGNYQPPHTGFGPIPSQFGRNPGGMV